MFKRDSLDEVQLKLEKIDAEITAHPLASGPVKEAQALIDANGGQDNDAVEVELAARDLPSLQELGKIQLAGTRSWWALHRRRKKLVKRRERLVKL